MVNHNIITRYNHSFKFKNIQDELGIPCVYGDHRLYLSSSKIDNNSRINIRIEFIYKHKSFYFDNLPPELNNKIEDFLYDKIVLNIIQVLPESYPFMQPLWVLSDIITPPQQHKLIEVYYCEKIRNHNEKISDKWTPALRIEKDILIFMTTVMGFRDIFETIYTLG